MLHNIKNIVQKCKSYGIQKVLILGLLTANRLAEDFVEEVNKLFKSMYYIEGYCTDIMKTSHLILKSFEMLG